MHAGVSASDAVRPGDDIKLGLWDDCCICTGIGASIQNRSDPRYLFSKVSQIQHTPNDMTYQVFDTSNHPSRAGHEVYVLPLQPMGYQPAKVRPCASESTRRDSCVDGVCRGTHIQGLEYAVADKVREAHARQSGNDVCTNHVHLLSILSRW